MPTHTNASTPVAGVPLQRDDLVALLDDLMENARDGEYGFMACADEVDAAQLKPFFLERASGFATAAQT